MKLNVPRGITRRIGKAIGRYDMIQEGDRIAVGVSGGKDSITLLTALRYFQNISHVRFNIAAVHLDMGWGQDISPLQDFCEAISVPFHLEKTNIGPIVFEARRESNPCALCANLRRGALNNTAVLLGCNKVALGHHLDDAIETVLLSMFYEGRFHCFKPVTYLDRKDITVIRPMIYVKEEAVAQAVKDMNWPVMSYPCQASPRTKRAQVKQIISDLEERIPGLRDRLLSSLEHVPLEDLWRPIQK